MKRSLALSIRTLLSAAFAAVYLFCGAVVAAQTPAYDFNDSHFHLTNNIQEGPDIRDFLNMMSDKAGRVAVFGVPLRQEWSYRVDGERAPTYYLHSDTPLYYYSFTDAWIAMAYKSLTKEQQARFDPMITASIRRTCTPPTTSGACCKHFRGCSAASANSLFTGNLSPPRLPARWPAWKTLR